MTLERTTTNGRKRPRNRRALILAAASDLFARDGYDQAGMSELAAAVGIGPSALYRHFPGKQHLLAEVVAVGLEPVEQHINALQPGHSDALDSLAPLALDERHLGVLWHREARHMTAEDRARLRERLRAIGQRLTAHLRTINPSRNEYAADLLAWSIIALLTSVSFHHLELVRPAYDELLAEMTSALLHTELPATFAAPPATREMPALTPASRREAILNHAIRLFAVDGYSEVSIDDIGQAAGITGPSVYNHYTSKLDMLTTGFQRGTAALFMDAAAAYTSTRTAPAALDALTRSYISFAQAHHHIIGLLITETGHLPAEEQRRARQAQHDYLSEWVHLLRMVHPHTDPRTARIRVHAAINIINSAARTPHHHRNPDLPEALARLCGRVLQPRGPGEAGSAG